MGIFDKVKPFSATSRLIEEQYYEAVVDELRQGIKRSGLWAKAIVKSEGNEEKAKALYITYRVQSIKDEMELAEVSRKKEKLRRKNQADVDRLAKERQEHNEQIEINSSILVLLANGHTTKKKGYGWLVTDTINFSKKKILSTGDLHKYAEECKRGGT